MNEKTCVFCDGKSLPQDTERFVVGREGVMVFEPLDPVVPGHLLVVPNKHVANATENPYLTSLVMHIAAEVAGRYTSANIITSIGEPATQSVFHLHVHVVPREPGDGLLLPWSVQQAEARARIADAERAAAPILKISGVKVARGELTVAEPRMIDAVRHEIVSKVNLPSQHTYDHGLKGKERVDRRCYDLTGTVLGTRAARRWWWWRPYSDGFTDYGWTACDLDHSGAPRPPVVL